MMLATAVAWGLANQWGACAVGQMGNPALSSNVPGTVGA
jgi:hypothetical protein